jgi:hypothetical protein
MRSAVLLFVLATALPAQRPDYRGEDTASIAAAFRIKTPTAAWTRIIAIQRTDLAHRAILAMADSNDGKQQTLFGIFVVSGKNNHVDRAIEIAPLTEVNGSPELTGASPDAIYLDFVGDYGFYRGTTRYLYELNGSRPPRKTSYLRLELLESKKRGETLEYSAGAGPWDQTKWFGITIHPVTGNSAPRYKIANLPSRDRTPPNAPRSIELSGGGSIEILETGLRVVSPQGQRKVYPAPSLTMREYLERRKQAGVVEINQPPLKLEPKIGPAALDGNTLWFVTTFYDGEGTSGLGGIGAFHLETNTYTMMHPRRLVPYAGSALLLDGDDVWIGMMTRPEGAAFGTGLLRFNRRTKETQRYEVLDYVYTIDRLGDAIYVGTVNGLYVVRGNALAHYRFEPDESGSYCIR